MSVTGRGFSRSLNTAGGESGTKMGGGVGSNVVNWDEQKTTR